MEKVGGGLYKECGPVTATKRLDKYINTFYVMNNSESAWRKPNDKLI